MNGNATLMFMGRNDGLMNSFSIHTLAAVSR